jgi:hypothetical protein
LHSVSMSGRLMWMRQHNGGKKHRGGARGGPCKKRVVFKFGVGGKRAES